MILVESRRSHVAVFRTPLITLGLAVATLLAVFSINTANAETDTVSGETSVTETQEALDEIGTPLEAASVQFWPEYDQPSVLVIYSGRLDSSASLPATVKLALPKGENVRISGVSGISADGQHDHERSEPTRKTVDAGDKTILSFDTYYQEFQFELYMNPVSGKGKRDFDFDLPMINEVQTLNVGIKRPVRADGFTVAPTAQQVRAENGFDDHLYSFSDVAPGREYSFKVSYSRADSQPSIDPDTGRVNTVSSRTRAAVFIVFLIGLFGLGIAAGFWRMRSAPAKPVKAQPVKKKSSAKQGAKGSKKNFCPSCGETAGTGSKFCSSCGESL